jgi:hypothetical protein
MMMGPGEAHYFRDYKRLGPIAKLATSYFLIPFRKGKGGEGRNRHDAR